MIGQEKLRQKFEELVERNKLPRFILLIGQRGLGKTTLAEEIYNILKKQDSEFVLFKLPDVKIDTVREMIKLSYTVSSPSVFIISDADDMSVGAKNALLKITEEPPNNAYIIMTLEDKNNTLETIISRAATFNMVPYSEQEKKQYMELLNAKVDKEDEDLILNIANNFYDIRQLLSDGVQDFYLYVEKVVDNIAEVSGANAFKIANKVAIKADDKGYELELFFKLFQYICLNRMHNEEEKDKWLNGIIITNKHFLDLNIRGVNRQFVIDSWILEIRRAWM